MGKLPVNNSKSFLPVVRVPALVRKKLVKTLPKMQEAATPAELKEAFGNRLTQTQNHVSRLIQSRVCTKR
ncbi:MAG: Ferritin-like metal-binding protein YciE [Mucilaginibacter sp.]|nr:Ferritin-like metal-binding protein YciE [Mucilaginibacter sp.]